jgi:hypothetical protein
MQKTLINWLLIAGLLLLVSGGHSRAYVASGRHWASPPTWYINPTNSSGFTLTQIRTALEPVSQAWCAGGQTTASCSSTYGGTTSGRTTGNNGKNEVFFSPVNEGSTRTVYWYNGSLEYLDVDIVVVDLKYPYFTQTGCVNGIYLEEIMIHEFGHFYGLSHSTVSGATMQSLLQGYCTRTQLSLASDDIAGIEFLYEPGGSPPPVNTAPTVTISSPTNNSSHAATDSISFAATATDTQDGTLSSSLRWNSNLVGEIGTGASFSKTLPVGVHTVTASVTDSGGLIGLGTVTLSVNTVSTAGTLTVQGYKVKGLQKADLTWTNIVGTNVDVYRDGVKKTTTTNDGAYTDAINAKGGGRAYVYKVCAAGSITSCTNEATMVF